MSKLVALALCLLCSSILSKGVDAFATNWGTVSSEPLPGDVVVKLLQDNGFTKVKLFNAEPEPLKALANSKIEVMVGIGNDYLDTLGENQKVADDWVAQNVSAYIKSGVDIRYVAVSNEAFLKDFKDKYIHSVLPALKAIKTSLGKAGLGDKVKLTVPLNADIYESYTGAPSGGDFRFNVTKEVVGILKFLNDNKYPIAINIYPYLSLYYDSNFPKEYAFFNSSLAGLVDGKFTYTNAFDGNLDTLLAALDKHDLGDMEIIVGEVGWPTNGAHDANNANAQRFYQGLIDRINKKKGTPRRPDNMPEVYMFGLIDENAKSVLPGNFEPHWGIFNYDGSIKYQLDMGGGKKLVAAKDVKYMEKKWCILDPKANINDPKMKENWQIACGGGTGCTSVSNGSACEWLDDRTKASYVFNAFYQLTKQNKKGCDFNGLGVITEKDPSPKNGTACNFDLALDLGTSASSPAPTPSAADGGDESGSGGSSSKGSDSDSKKSMAVGINHSNSLVIMGISMVLGLLCIIF